MEIIKASGRNDIPIVQFGVVRDDGGRMDNQDEVMFNSDDGFHSVGSHHSPPPAPVPIGCQRDG